MSRNAPARYRATRITLALGTGIAVVAGGVFLAGNGNNGATTLTSADSALVTTGGATATPTAIRSATKSGDDGEERDSNDSSTNQATTSTTQPAAQATVQPTVSTQTSRVSRGS